MRIDIPLSGRAYIPAWNTGLEMMLRATRSYLTGLPGSQLPPLVARIAEEPAGWEKAVEAAHHNRLSAFVLPGLKQNGIEIPPDAEAMLQHYRTDTFRLNTRNLMTIRQVVPLIEQAGIPVMVIKGPIQQQLTYGDFFAKPSGDVDLLVSPKDFTRAKAIIETAGYFLPEECASPWWRIFLGEQHLLAKGPILSTIDLHHRVQQPGAPSPRMRERFLANRRVVPVGAGMVPVMAEQDALLLQAMSLVKALGHREPAGGYAADILAGLRNYTPEQLADLVETASSQGLRNTLRLALRAVEVLFGCTYDISLPGEPRILDSTTDDDLFGMVLVPEGSPTMWPKRRSILWEAVDTGFAGYSREVIWAVGGEACRRLFQVAPPKGRASAAPAAAG